MTELTKVTLPASRFDRDKGDIGTSYSADCLCEKKPVRTVFKYGGKEWLVVAVYGSTEYRAYQVVAPGAITDVTPCPYPGPCERDDERGGYHGMLFKTRGTVMALAGPCVVFSPGPEEEQFSLFGAATEREVNEQAAEDSRRLLAEQLSAEFGSPLNRHNQRRRLRAEQDDDGAALFDHQIQGQQGGLF